MTDGREPQQHDDARGAPPPSRPPGSTPPPPPSRPTGSTPPPSRPAGAALPPPSRPQPQQQPAEQQPAQHQPAQHQPLPPPKRSRLLVVLLAAGAAIVTVVAVSVVASTVWRANTSEPIAIESGPPYYSASDRPGWAELEATVQRLDTEWDAAAADGSIYDRVPATVNADQYVQDFRVVLADKINAFRFFGGGSYDEGELDATIQAFSDELLEIERKFLAGEPFGVTYTITRPDGTTVTGDGTATPVAGAVDFSRTFAPGPAADGTYAPAVIELAGQFGLLVDWDFQNIYASCAREQDDTFFIAAYCLANDDRIFVNRGHQDYDQLLRSPDFVEVMRHEIAHHEIGRICGTTGPRITGGLVEGVTNSYAVLVLGADRDRIVDINEGFPEYAMSAETDDIALQIFEDETCG